MRNLKLEIEYDGANYCGWQVQKRKAHTKRSVQETIEKALRKILQEKIRLMVSGRTDAGVHARAQVANFKTKSGITKEKLQLALNGILPKDISINRIEEKPLNFHSRFSAKAKVYRYYILNRRHSSALLRKKAHFVSMPLDLGLMRETAKELVGRHNFKSFCAAAGSAKDTVRNIKSIAIKKVRYSLNDVPLIAIDIEGDGFLYNMVRNIVGTLIEIGRGRFKKTGLKKILLAEDRKSAGQTAPAKGLYLYEVKY